jgi:hypothetical protein
VLSPSERLALPSRPKYGSCKVKSPISTAFWALH